ncbi:MAG TPA: amidohydrolase family protein, partial [Iamia sp.]
EAPSTYFFRNVYACFFRDDVGVEMIERVGPDNITFETDYPHTDSTWPDTKEIATGFMRGLPEESVYKIMRGNAIRMLSLDLDRDRVPAPA